MRATFSQRGDEIVGTTELPGDGAFVLECLAIIVEKLAEQSGVPKQEVVTDLYSVVMGKVT